MCAEAKPASFLKEAKRLEGQYDWIGAAKLYDQASTLALEKRKFLKAASLFNKLGNACRQAAYQADSKIEFRKRNELAAESYGKVYELYKEKTQVSEPEKKHAEAQALVAKSWIEPEKDKQEEIIDQYINLEEQALKTYEEAGDYLNFGKACNRLLSFLGEARIWRMTSSEKQKLFDLGEKSIKIFSNLNDSCELAKVYIFMTLCYISDLGHMSSQIERNVPKEQTKKCIAYSKKALEVSKKTANDLLIGRANLASGFAINTCDPATNAIDFFKEAVKCAEITKNIALKGTSYTWLGMYLLGGSSFQENPEDRRRLLKEALKAAQESIRNFKIQSFFNYVMLSYKTEIQSLVGLASLETNMEAKRALLNKALESGLEGLKFFSTEQYVLAGLGIAYFQLALLETDEKKKKLLEEALKNIELSLSIEEISKFKVGDNYFHRGLILHSLAKLETKEERKIVLLTNAAASLEKSAEMHLIGPAPTIYRLVWSGRSYYWFGRILDKLYALRKDPSAIERAIEVYHGAIRVLRKAKMDVESAESYWQLAKLYDRIGKYPDSAKHYFSASKSYANAGKKIPQLTDFYGEHALYMQAWGNIENARVSHENEEYDHSKSHYEKAVELLKATESWRHFAPNYSAWARVEEAEDLSRKERSQEAKKCFHQAIEEFKKGKATICSKSSEILTEEESEMVSRLAKASSFKKAYCDARVRLEEAKIFEKQGKYNPSSTSYESAAEKIKKLIGESESEKTSQELRLIMTLCKAWQKMVLAEKLASPEIYMEAANFFEDAKKFSSTRRTTLLALGNSSFCKGLASGTIFQETLDLRQYSSAKGYLESAANNYLQAGFKGASEYAIATQRLYDAFLYLNSAERESDPEKSTKHYQMAEKVLLISTGSFTKAGQLEKRDEVQRILEKVREEKELASSLSHVFRTPGTASTTYSFITPSQTSGEAVGLERFEHANVKANLVVDILDARVGENFTLEAEFVNTGKEPALLTKIEKLIPEGFSVVGEPLNYRVEKYDLNMKGKQLNPMKMEEVKLILQPLKAGLFSIAPRVHYLDDLGNIKILIPKTITVDCKKPIKPNRNSTGTAELDNLLLGGIPQQYAVVLTGPPSDEREIIIKNFLEAGTKEGQTSFYVTTEADGIDNLLEKTGFYLFLCNPKPKTEVPDLLNVYKLHAKTDLTNLNIALLKAYRNVEASSNKRICINIVSDVLVDYGLKATRKWIAELTTDLVSKNFTVLAVMNPGMHPSDQATGIIDLFDGEISLIQSQDPYECKKSLQIKKLRNQDYIKNPICLT